MMKFFDKIKFWYKNARPYSVPITVLSWLVIFCYGVKNGGNILNGLISLVGILLVHLSTNLSDDYFDFKRLSQDEINNSKSIKCRYLRNGQATIEDLRNVIFTMLFCAALIGGFLLLRSGAGVIFFAIAVLPIALFYSKLSSKGLGDLAVILAYGPLMFEGVYYVMTKSVSWDVLILSVPCALLVESILYAHMYMDFDEDKNSGKTTLCTILKTKQNSLKFLELLYVAAYLSVILFALKSGNWFYLLTLPIILMVFDLINMLKSYDLKSLNVRFWHYPLDNWKTVGKNPDAPFFLRFMYCRNIAVWFMLLTCFAIFMQH